MSVAQPNIKTRAASVSVASNTALVAGKLCVGLAIGSVSIISEAIHSGIDLVAAVIAWWAVRASSAPADDEHPFGHGKFENLSGVIEALLILVAAIWIVVEAMPSTCALELADIGGMRLEEVAMVMGMARPRIEQLEILALRKLAKSREIRKARWDGR